MSQAILVQGLAFGDEGKGSIVDYLTREHRAHTVVRFNGGAQAAHNVVLADGRHHTFAQWGSGTFAGAHTHLSKYVLVNPVTLMNEGARLLELGIPAFDRITVHQDALITTPLHMAANRRKEQERGAAAHGSCGMGIGETVETAAALGSLALRAGDLLDVARHEERISALARHYEGTIEFDFKTYAKAVRAFTDRVQLVDDAWLDGVLSAGTTIFEGAQGVLLDQDFGFHPHTTWSDCTFGNADKLLAGKTVTTRRIGVLRSYLTRHGAGPFPTEDSTLHQPEAHNGMHPWAGAFRLGHFDLDLARYARHVIGPLDGVALTHLDRPGTGKVCVQYENTGLIVPRNRGEQAGLATYLKRVKPLYEELLHYTAIAARLEQAIGTRVVIGSYGPTAADKKAWP